MITLTAIAGDHPGSYEALIAATAAYEKEFGVRVSWQKKSLADLAAQSLPALAKQCDLVIIDYPRVGVACDTNCLLPFDNLLTYEALQQLEQQSAGPSFLSYYYQQQQWALPVQAAVQCAASRPDLLGEHPIPETWEEVFELMETLQQQNLQVGMALCPGDCACTFLSLTAQFGSSVRENNFLLTSKEVGIQALELMRTIRDNFHANSLDWTAAQLYDHMTAQDDIAYSPLVFGYAGYSREGFAKNKLRFHNAPWMKNVVLGGAGIGVSANSSHTAAAGAFAAWLCSAATQNGVFVKENGQPGNVTAWKDDNANAIAGNFFNNTYDTLAYAYVRPRYSGWPAFEKWMGEAIHQYLKEGADPAATIELLQEAYAKSYTLHL